MFKKDCDQISMAQNYECEIILNKCDSNGMLNKPSICIDKCLKDEILWLWSKGIKTLGCCCGNHYNDNIGIPTIVTEDYDVMKQLGYENLYYKNINPVILGRNTDEYKHIFVAKTKINNNYTFHEKINKYPIKNPKNAIMLIKNIIEKEHKYDNNTIDMIDDVAYSYYSFIMNMATCVVVCTDNNYLDNWLYIDGKFIEREKYEYLTQYDLTEQTFYHWAKSHTEDRDLHFVLIEEDRLSDEFYKELDENNLQPPKLFKNMTKYIYKNKKKE